MAMNYRRRQKARDFFFLVGDSSQPHMVMLQQHPFGMKCYSEVLHVQFSFPVMGRSAFQREKQMFLLAPVTASRKNECRKLLWPLLLFTLYFFHLNSSVCFFAWFFVGFLWVFCGWVLFCGNRSPGEKERIDYMFNQPKERAINHLSQLLDKASPRFPRQTDLKAVAPRTKGQGQSRAAEPRERAVAGSPWGTGAQGTQPCCKQHRVGKQRQNLLFMGETASHTGRDKKSITHQPQPLQWDCHDHSRPCFWGTPCCVTALTYTLNLTQRFLEV